MEHNYAIQNHTAERYLLEELPQDEREAYEEHFFNCRLCAEEVQAASEFIDGARELIQNQVKEELYGHAKQHSIWGSWLNWRSIMQPLPAMACMLLVFVSGFSAYQNRVTIPLLSTPQVLVQQPPIRHAKGDAVSTLMVQRGKGFLINVDIPPANYAAYDASVVTQSNKTKLLLKDISAQQARDSVQIFVPAGKLDPGRYFLVITGTENKGEVDRIPFDITFQD